VTARPRLTVIGDALLDRDIEGRAERLAPDAPVPVVDEPVERTRPGGAALAAALAARAGADVTLVCALGDDHAGRVVAELLQRRGVALCDLGSTGPTPEKVRVHASGRPVGRLDHGGAPGRPGVLGQAARDALARADAVRLSDYGRGVAAAADVRAAVRSLGAVPVVWDPHPRGPEPVPGATLVTPNLDEAGRPGASLAAVEDAARALTERWQAVNVCVTRGDRGAVVVHAGGPALVVGAVPCEGGDPCGAGDCFAATAAVALARGTLPSEAVRLAVQAATSFVRSGGAAAFGRAVEPVVAEAGGAAEVIARVRARGGTVVATGGCFDLLHAGHVRMLQAARALGDCLVVLLNSDASVARLKGPERPLVGEEDRAAVLGALECVDAVLVFEEDDPRAALESIRPDLWAKGGDYAVADLPEAQTLAGWGGRAVIVPYVAGRSTTRLIEEVVARAG
jgi:rfaE bifunctional protein nucleotidyltransferase chain/domain/rfaE bifunctional protein kinase chain/domain